MSSSFRRIPFQQSRKVGGIQPQTTGSASSAAGGLAALVAAEPLRFTAADRLEEIPVEASRTLLEEFETDPARLDGFLAALDESLVATDRTDGLRLTLASGRIAHIRPSGNAPEFRFYAEAESPEQAEALPGRGLGLLRDLLTPRAASPGA